MEIHYEIEKRITVEGKYLRETFEKELQLQRRFMGSNLVDICICSTFKATLWSTASIMS